MKHPLDKWHLYLGILAMLLLLSGMSLAFQLFKSIQEEKGLRDALEVLEAGFESERQAKQLQFDSLQQEITAQEKQQQELQESLQQLQQHKNQLRTSYEKEKHALARIRSADSLRDAIARRYR